MKQAPLHAIVYDLSKDRERTRVDRLLKGYGFRVQKSVFECRLTRSGGASLQRELKALELTSGSVKIYRLNNGARHPVIGIAMPDPDGAHAYVF